MIKIRFIFVSILLSIAYLTLLERKLLSLRQSRQGPQTVGSLGLLQPISDGIKLIIKKEVI